ncbi:TlpA disulfide reductase family protein [Sedimentibacter sp.]|uniref:TlpA family protein disulfide reductase n=1 Tax=Sedimentibacter sp. TaxID=1960295 RepID=UPI0028A20AA7|nr:TlpA disulfide reductase family protein [Sedimentibacter sp.]
MKKILILLMIAILLAGCTDPIIPAPEETPEQAPEETPEIKNPKDPLIAPDFELEALDGTKIKLSEAIKDKNVILNFWATWCGFCVIEMPDLEELQKAHEDDLLIIAINVGETKEKVQGFVDEMKLNLTVVLDGDMKVNNNYGVRSYPTTLAINKKGEAVGAYVGMLTYTQMEQLYGLFEEE